MPLRLAALVLVLLTSIAHARGVVLTIVDKQGNPVPGAVVWDGTERKADATGRVRIDSIDALENWDVYAPGFATTSIAVQVDDPKSTGAQTVVLERGSRLSGRVVDPDGKPVAKADVVVMDNFGFHRTIASTGGVWSVAAVGPGKHRVAASGGRWVQTQEVAVETDGVQVTDGLVLVLRRGATLDGIVVDAAGKPVVGAEVSVALATAKTDAAGKFSIAGLVPASRKIQAKSGSASSPLQDAVLVDNKRTTVRLVVAGGSLAGTVVDGRGQPLADARVEARSGNEAAFGRTDAQGHFDLGGVVAGNYSLRAQRDGARGDHGKSLVVNAIAGTRDVRIAIPDGGALTGRVIVDGKPARFFGIAVDETYIVKPEGRRVTDGKFAERDLTPGSWKLAIVVPGFVPKHLTPTINSGATLDLGDIVMDRGRVLHGRVLDAKGAPVANALVQINTGSFTPPESLWEQLEGRIATRTDVDGRYVLAGIETNKVIRVEARDLAQASSRRVLRVNDDNVELSLRPLGAVTGTIVNPDPDWKKRQVVAQDLSDPASFYEVLADLDGDFVLDDLPVGDYLLYVDGRAAVRVSIGAGAKTSTVIP